MQIRIGNLIQHHGKITVDLIGRCAAVMVRMFDIMGPNAQPPLGELNGILQLRGAANGTPPDGADGTAHFDARIPAFF